MILDQTHSTLAKEFYIGFSQIWRNHPVPSRSSVILEERVDVNYGPIIQVRAKHQVIYSNTLNRRLDNAERGREAAKQVLRQLRNPNWLSARSADLAADEI